ncbi:hypothetical protein GCM10022254_53890 [Actinomadura meridiana]|uniref:Uncharacterized protein n=1 Tax=Actinomadura meridiana TaxID=559626 RepID=A0ABP8CEH6_9ACTN
MPALTRPASPFPRQKINPEDTRPDNRPPDPTGDTPRTPEAAPTDDPQPEIALATLRQSCNS